jgi:hypothetical protein
LVFDLGFRDPIFKSMLIYFTILFLNRAIFYPKELTIELESWALDNAMTSEELEEVEQLLSKKLFKP